MGLSYDTIFVLVVIIIVVIVILSLLLFKTINNSTNTNVSDEQSTSNVSLDEKIKPYFPLSHDANSLVLSCMDFRFINQTVEYLYGRNETEDFDYFVLAGASLGYNESNTYNDSGCIHHNKLHIDPAWKRAYEDHIRLAIDLHDIKEIIVIDHMDCGMYRAVYGDICSKAEQKLHIENIHKFIDSLKSTDEFGWMKYEGILIQVVDEGDLKFKVVYEEEVN